MPNIFVLLPVLRLALEEVTKGKKKNLVQKIPGKTRISKFAHFFKFVSDLDSGSVTVSGLDNNNSDLDRGLLAVQIKVMY